MRGRDASSFKYLLIALKLMRDGDGLKSEQHFCVVSSAVDTCWYRTTTSKRRK